MKKIYTKPLFYIITSILICLVLGMSYGFRNNILKSGIENVSPWKVKYSLFFGGEPSYKFDEDLDQLIYFTIMKDESKKSLEILNLCLKECDFINYNFDGETLLTQALIDKKNQFVKLILSNSTEIKKSNREGFKPIFFVMDNYEISKLLVEFGAELDNIDSDNNSIFHWPLNIKKLELFYSSNSSIINKRNNEGIPPLIASLIRRDSVQFANLLEIGANPTVSDSDGKYSMSYAAELSKYTHWAKFLREAGGDVNQKNDDGTTPIFFVQTNKMMQYLIKWGGEVDVEDNESQTPVHYYVVNDKMEDESFELIISFLERFVVDKLDDKGETAIMYAAQENLEKKFFILYNKFESNNYQFKNPTKVLEYAKIGGNQRIIRSVEQKVFRQTGNRYVSASIASTANWGGSRSTAAAGLKRITRRKLIQKGVGKVLSRAIPFVGTALLVKDIYDLIKN